MMFFNLIKNNKIIINRIILINQKNHIEKNRLIRTCGVINHTHSNIKENVNNSEKSSTTTHFGYETVNISEKEEKVHKVFEDVAESYDKMNDAMSLGIHRIWKDIFMERLAPIPGTNLLDMAGGTGDIAFRYVKYLRNISTNQQSSVKSGSQVTVSDINQNMLDVGIKRAKTLGYYTDDNDDDDDDAIKSINGIKMTWKCENAEKLTFENEQFNAYTIAFGIRNCTSIERVLSEAYRVLKPGGRFLCLEFSHLNNQQLQWLYDQYSFTVIPPLGQILAGQWKAYQYLVESIRKFPQQDDFKAMIKSAGFSCVTYENLTFGVCSIHSGFKL